MANVGGLTTVLDIDSDELGTDTQWFQIPNIEHLTVGLGVDSY